MSAAGPGFQARAGLPGGPLTDADIRRQELDRARHALTLAAAGRELETTGCATLLPTTPR